MERTRHLTERQISVTLPADELAALDAYCASQRRLTGDPWPRAVVIRLAINGLVAASQAALSPNDRA